MKEGTWIRWHEWRPVRWSRGQDTMQGAALPLTPTGLDLFPYIHTNTICICLYLDMHAHSYLRSVSPRGFSGPTHVRRQHTADSPGISKLREYNQETTGQVSALYVLYKWTKSAELGTRVRWFQSIDFWCLSQSRFKNHYVMRALSCIT